MYLSYILYLQLGNERKEKWIDDSIATPLEMPMFSVFQDGRSMGN